MGKYWMLQDIGAKI